MGLNDHAEKLRQAYEWLATAPRDSETYKAAFEHLGGTDFAAYQQHVSLTHLDHARADVTEITLHRMRRQMAAEMADKGVIPLSLPRHAVTEHRITGDPFYGLATFHMFVPVREP